MKRLPALVALLGVAALLTAVVAPSNDFGTHLGVAGVLLVIGGGAWEYYRLSSSDRR